MDIKELIIGKPTPGLDEHIRYGSYIQTEDEENDVEQINNVLLEQCQETLIAIKKERGELPVAIYFYDEPDPDKPNCRNFWWNAWTDAKKP